MAVMAVIADGCGGSAPVAPSGAGAAPPRPPAATASLSTTATLAPTTCAKTASPRASRRRSAARARRAAPCATASAPAWPASPHRLPRRGRRVPGAHLRPGSMRRRLHRCRHRFTHADSGDCKQTVCDGKGASITKNDNGDVPDDKNACTDDICTDGAPSNRTRRKAWSAAWRRGHRSSATAQVSVSGATRPPTAPAPTTSARRERAWRASAAWRSPRRTPS